MPRVKSAKKPAAPGGKPQKQATAPPKSTAVVPKDQEQAEPPRRGRYRMTGPELAPEVRKAGHMAVSSVFNAIGVMEPLQKNLGGAEATASGLMLAVDDHVAQVQAGDMSEVESMLLSQAMSLQTIYASLARRATAQDHLKQYQTYLTLALKAQAQSRATLEALIELKQPRHAPTFIKQANMANGPQQVNNGAAPPALPPRAEETATAPSKLLETDTAPTFEYVNKGVNEHERLEQGAPRAPS